MCLAGKSMLPAWETDFIHKFPWHSLAIVLAAVHIQNILEAQGSKLSDVKDRSKLLQVPYWASRKLAEISITVA